MRGDTVKAKVLSILILVTFLIVISSFSAGCTKKTEPSSSPPPNAQNNPPVQEPAGPKPLPGLVLVSIGNNPSARPQSGLNEAALVYECLAEGGITRLFAGFTHEVDKIGPVRSARTFYVEIAMGHQTVFAHCGGSSNALALIKNAKAQSLDEIYSAGECFWRSQDRKSPDNLYTSTSRLVEGATRRGYTLTQLNMWDEGKLSGQSALNLEYDFSDLESYRNVVSYQYKDGAYLRSINGEAHLDASGKQIAPVNLVFMEVTLSYPNGHQAEPEVGLVGEGKALFASGGLYVTGTWKKASSTAPLQFFSADGTKIALPEGLTWVHMVRDMRLVKVDGPKAK